MYLDDLISKVNESFARSSIGRLFRLEGSGHVCFPPSPSPPRLVLLPC